MKAFIQVLSCVLFILAFLGGTSVSAAVIYPVSATTTGGNLNPLPNYAVEYLFNEGVTGPGDTLDNTVTNHEYAYCSARPVPGGYPVIITADFDGPVDLSALYLWNAGNPNKTIALEKGVKDFSLTFWDGPGATGSQVGSVFTAIADRAADYGANQPEIPGQIFTFPSSSYYGVQSVEFRLINNYEDDPAQWVGVREIAFQPGTTGDANGDGVVDAADYILVKKNMGQAPGAGDPGNGGDFDGDGTVDWDDLQTLIYAMNAGTPGGQSPTIPEPATLFVMLAAGLPALLKRRRSRS